jgi:hypothetical protein
LRDDRAGHWSCAGGPASYFLGPQRHAAAFVLPKDLGRAITAASGGIPNDVWKFASKGTACELRPFCARGGNLLTSYASNLGWTDRCLAEKYLL